MADYFSNLVDQTFGLLPVFQPLIPSLYAPAPQDSSLLHEQEIEVEVAQPAKWHTPALQPEYPASAERGSIHAQTSSLGNPMPAEPGIRASVERTPPDRLQPIHEPKIATPQPGTPLVPEEGREIAPPIASASQLTRPESSQGANVPAWVELQSRLEHLEMGLSKLRTISSRAEIDLPQPLVEHPAEAGAQAAGLLDIDQPDQPEAVWRATPQGTIGYADRSGEPSDARPGLVGTSQISPVVIPVAMQPPVGSPHESAPAPDPQATIQVHIGRIEVRAVMPSAQPVQKQTRPATAVMSLDEYLRQRNGGR